MNRVPACDGVLVVDKPNGPTSHDIVVCVRRALHLKKVGHLGTLDPLATGVLPLVVGRATRLAPLFAGSAKQYSAVILLGLTTDTADITGTVTRSSAERLKAGGPSKVPALPTPETIAAVASSFVGSYLQRPPEMSAKKVGGIRAYKLARQRRPAQLEPVPVTLETFTILSNDGPRLRCRVVCSSGFYVRALARDLGTLLGCGGCLETLRRERHGTFGLSDSVSLSRVVEDGVSIARNLIPIDALLPEVPRVVVNDQGAHRVAHGNLLQRDEVFPTRSGAPILANKGPVRILNRRGNLLAIGECLASGALHPKIVLV